MKNKLKNYLRLLSLSMVLTLLLVNCNNDDSVIEEETLTIENPIALKLQEMTPTTRYLPDASNLITSFSNGENDQTISFEEKYGKVMYEYMGEDTKSSFHETILPLIDENNNLKTWLIGFYNDDNEIEYRVRKINESDNSISFIDGGDIVYDFSDTTVYVLETPVTNNIISSLSSAPLCGETIRVVCGFYDANDNGIYDYGDGDLQCNTFSTGSSCSVEYEYYPNGSGNNGTGDDDGWENPFGDDEGDGGNGGDGFNDSLGAEEPEPIEEYATTCEGINSMWDDYPDNETFGYITQGGKLILVGIAGEHGGDVPKLEFVDGKYYYSFPPTDNLTLEYEGIVKRPHAYFIPIRASVHTHNPCRFTSDSGVGHTVGPEDQDLAKKYPGINHYAIGCNAIAQFKDSPYFFNTKTGELDNFCDDLD